MRRALLGLALSLTACSTRASAPPPQEQTVSPAPASPASASPALCRSAADMARLDGQRVLVEGVYQKKMEQLQMPRPGRPEPPPVFRGLVELRLEGSAEVYDPTMPEDEPAALLLGQGARPEEELARLDGQRVRVEGRLVLDGDSLLSPAELEVARPSTGPVLVDLGTPELAP